MLPIPQGGDVMRSVIFLFLTVGLLITRVCFAHDADGRPNWIAEGAYRGSDGVHCCGPSDCEQLSSDEVQVRPRNLADAVQGTGSVRAGDAKRGRQDMAMSQPLG